MKNYQKVRVTQKQRQTSSLVLGITAKLSLSQASIPYSPLAGYQANGSGTSATILHLESDKAYVEFATSYTQGSQALPYDDAHDVFMTLPAHTSSREGAGQLVLSRAMRLPTDKPPS